MMACVRAIAVASGLALLAATASGCKGCARRPGASASHGGDRAPEAGEPDLTAARRERLVALEAPPWTAPKDAWALPSGAKWRMVKPGSGDALDGASAVRAELTIWKTDGTLAFSSYNGPVALPLLLSVLPGDLRVAFMQVRVGGIAQFWLPRDLIVAAAKAGRKPRIVPEEDVVMQYEPVSFARPSPAAADLSSGPRAADASAGAETTSSETFPPPDAAGPPKEALAAGVGVRYVVLRAGSGTSAATPNARVEMSMTLWQIKGLLVDGPVKKNEPVATTPERAPGGLSQFVRTLHEGDVVRVWLSPDRASQVFPDLGGFEIVCDIAVRSVGR
jgi:FKBP-type peptidyl-prolyl cis-trans isomerase